MANGRSEKHYDTIRYWEATRTRKPQDWLVLEGMIRDTLLDYKEEGLEPDVALEHIDDLLGSFTGRGFVFEQERRKAR